MKIDISELEMEERTLGVPRKFIHDADKEDVTPIKEVKITTDISELELEERTVGVPRKFVPDAQKEAVAAVKEVNITTDISDLELEERTISSQRRFVLDAHMEKVTPLDGRMFAASEQKKGRPKEASQAKNSGCCVALLIVGASVLLSVWSYPEASNPLESMSETPPRASLSACWRNSRVLADELFYHFSKCTHSLW